MTSENIRKVTFEKGMRGYRPEDVDDFLQQVAQSMDELTAERDAALEDRRAAESALSSGDSKMLVLAQKVEEYRGQEDTLKTALINAQRMGETVVHEAKQKAENMVREANGTAQLLREQAESEIARERITLEKLQAEVSRFKATILNLYKQHIESLSALDEPVSKIDDLMEEYEWGRGRAVQPAAPVPQPNNYAVEEPEIPDNKIEAAQDVGIDTMAAEEAHTNNFFEGVQLGGENPNAPASQGEV